MTQPIVVDIPHQLGREEARRRIDARFGKLAGFIPGASITAHRWDGDTLHFTVEGMGQTVAARMAVAADHVRAEIDLPPFLALFAGKIRETLASEGPKLLK